MTSLPSIVRNAAYHRLRQSHFTPPNKWQPGGEWQESAQMALANANTYARWQLLEEDDVRLRASPEMAPDYRDLVDDDFDELPKRDQTKIIETIGNLGVWTIYAEVKIDDEWDPIGVCGGFWGYFSVLDPFENFQVFDLMREALERYDHEQSAHDHLLRRMRS